MTAVDPLDELAFVLHGQGYCGEVCVCVDDARTLLPVVDQIAKARAAAELDRMARWTVDTGYADAAVLREFRDRADALGDSR